MLGRWRRRKQASLFSALPLLATSCDQLAGYSSMSFQIQTPQRPLPGAYYATPAPSQYQGASGTAQQSGPQRISPQNQTAQSNALSASGQATARPAEETLSPVERAAKTVNDTLLQELKYPELDSYIPRMYLLLGRWGLALTTSRGNLLRLRPVQHISMGAIPVRQNFRHTRQNIRTVESWPNNHAVGPLCRYKSRICGN